MPKRDLIYYCSRFKKIRRDYKNGGAPHKPILLISILQAFKNNTLNSNKIPISPELVGLFKSNWNSLVKTNHHCLFALPFYHMQSEPFWQLVPNPGCEIWVNSKSSMRSITNLISAVNHAIIEQELADLFGDSESSTILLQYLMETYFPKQRGELDSGNNSYILEVEKQIAKDSIDAYKSRLFQIRDQLDSESFQEEIYIRSSVFKREIPKAYNYSCCISGLRIDTLSNTSLVDACHIVPFSESYNDTIPNGIALCPNLHRAFDRGLIAIDDDYKVLVNNGFIEPNNSSYGIKQFEGKEILLPESRNLHPSLESLKYHRIKFDF
jgi:putative restriction endonuclease